MEYIPVETLEPEKVKNWTSKKEMDMTQSDMVTYATAFGQIKITGNLSPDLQERAINAIKRLSLVWGKRTDRNPNQNDWWFTFIYYEKDWLYETDK